MSEPRYWTEVEFNLIYEGRMVAAGRELGIKASPEATVTRERHDEQVLAAEIPIEDLKAWLVLGEAAVSESNARLDREETEYRERKEARKADIETRRPTAKGFAPPPRRYRQ